MAPAILRETSGGTSYLIARLVFRPYGQLRRTICTSVPLRTSTRVSPGLVLAVRSSRSFGSQRARSCSNLSKKSRSADSAEPKKAHNRPFCFSSCLVPFPKIGNLAFTMCLGLRPPRRLRARRTPWSVFQDGSLRAARPTSLTH